MLGFPQNATDSPYTSHWKTKQYFRSKVLLHFCTKNKNKQNQPRDTKQRWVSWVKVGARGVNVSVEVIGYGSRSPLNVVSMAY